MFPDGRLLSPRWRLVLWLDVVALVVGIVVVAFTPGNLAVNASVENPLGVDGVAATVVHATDVSSQCPSSSASCWRLSSLALRFRRSTGVERQQLKWFAFAALVAIGGFLLAGAGAVIPAPGVTASVASGGRSS